MLIFTKKDDVVSADINFTHYDKEYSGRLMFGTYAVNEAIAIDLYYFLEANDAYDGWQPYATLSVNLPMLPPEHSFYLKNYSENAELVPQFEGVLYKPMDENTRYVSSGYVDIPQVEFTDEIVFSLRALTGKPASAK